MRRSYTHIVYILLSFAFISTPCLSGEITHQEWTTNYLSLRYFDTRGKTAICTVFYKDNPVAVASSYIGHGIAKVIIDVPREISKDRKNTKTVCRTK